MTISHADAAQQWRAILTQIIALADQHAGRPAQAGRPAVYNRPAIDGAEPVLVHPEEPAIAAIPGEVDSGNVVHAFAVNARSWARAQFEHLNTLSPPSSSGS